MQCTRCGNPLLGKETTCGNCQTEFNNSKDFEYINNAINYSRELFLAQKYNEAVDFCQKQAVQYNQTPLFYNNLGALYYIKKNYLKSIDNYKKALNIYPELESSKEGLLFILNIMGNDTSNSLKINNKKIIINEIRSHYLKTTEDKPNNNINKEKDILLKQSRLKFKGEKILGCLKTGEYMTSGYVGKWSPCWHILFTDKIMRFIATDSASTFFTENLIPNDFSNYGITLTRGKMVSNIINIFNKWEKIRSIGLDEKETRSEITRIIETFLALFPCLLSEKEIMDEILFCRICQKKVKPYGIYCKFCGNSTETVAE